MSEAEEEVSQMRAWSAFVVPEKEPDPTLDSRGLSGSIGNRVGQLMDLDGLYSDVHFVVGKDKDTDTDKDKETIITETVGAHKLILALASPVFASMFYSQLDSLDVVAIPDCTPAAFKTALHSIYKGGSSGSNAFEDLTLDALLDVLYVGRKYNLASVELGCEAALLNKLSACEVFSVLNAAVFYDLRNLTDQCWAYIERNAVGVLECCVGGQANSIDRLTLNTILGKHQLNISECRLFTLLLKWGGNECVEKGLDPANITHLSDTLKDSLGLIRFPTMLGHEFADVVVPSGLLSSTQIANVLTYINAKAVKPAMTEWSAIPREARPSSPNLNEDEFDPIARVGRGRTARSARRRARRYHHS